MRTLLACIAAVAILLGCGTSRSTTLGAVNLSGIAVLVMHDGAVVGTLAPGFRGTVTDVSGWGYPRTVHVTTVAGTELGDAWDAQGEVNFDMAECGQIYLWVGSPDPSFDLGTPIPAAPCPSP